MSIYGSGKNKTQGQRRSLGQKRFTKFGLVHPPPTNVGPSVQTQGKVQVQAQAQTQEQVQAQ